MTEAAIESSETLSRERTSNTVKTAVIGFAALCLGYALIRLPESSLTLGFLLVVLFGTFVSPRMTLTLPRSKFAISFSDALVFVAFHLYGGEGAIILAAVETFANCIYLRRSGFHWGKLMIPVNVSNNVIATAARYLVLMFMQSSAGSDFNPTKTQHLISVLGVLALSQFVVSSFFAAVL